MPLALIHPDFFELICLVSTYYFVVIFFCLIRHSRVPYVWDLGDYHPCCGDTPGGCSPHLCLAKLQLSILL